MCDIIPPPTHNGVSRLGTAQRVMYVRKQGGLRNNRQCGVEVHNNRLKSKSIV